MKPRSTQFGVRENTATSRQHASRFGVSPSPSESERPLVKTLEDKQASAHVFPTAETFNLSLTEPECGATGGKREDTRELATDLNGNNERSRIEHPLTCEEAAELVRVHPKTVKRMARSGGLPGHFRFGRWFFYASELDCWMRTEVHSSRHSCR
jgi:excisionase family DNA binding protein